MDGEHDVRLQAALVQRVQRVAQALRVGRARRQVEVIVVVLRLELRLRVRVQQGLRRAARVIFHPVTRGDPVGHLAQRGPVDRRQGEHAAGLDVLPLETQRLVERDRRGAADHLHADRGEAFEVCPAGRHGDQLPAEATPAQRRFDHHLQDADVPEQQDADVREDLALPLGEAVVLGHPADPALPGQGLRQVIPHLNVLPRWIVGEIRGQNRVERLHERSDLPRRR
jgi:hypothetical protein